MDKDTKQFTMQKAKGKISRRPGPRAIRISGRVARCNYFHYLCTKQSKMMNSILTDRLQQTIQLCKAHHVKRLYAFGSVLTARFDRESDMDFIVDFDKGAIEDYFLNYFDFKYALESLFNREVDLLEEQPIRNRYLKQSIDNSKTLLYAR